MQSSARLAQAGMAVRDTRPMGLLVELAQETLSPALRACARKYHSLLTPATLARRPVADVLADASRAMAEREEMTAARGAAVPAHAGAMPPLRVAAAPECARGAAVQATENRCGSSTSSADARLHSTAAAGPTTAVRAGAVHGGTAHAGARCAGADGDSHAGRERGTTQPSSTGDVARAAEPARSTSSQSRVETTGHAPTAPAAGRAPRQGLPH